MAGVRECADETVSRALQAVEESPLELEAPTVPRQICPPKRLTGNAPGHKVTGPREFFRIELVKVLDTACMQISERFEGAGGYLQYWRDNPARGLRDGHKEILFGNYRDIYLCNSAFLLELQRCRADPLRVAKCFVAHQLRFDVYTDYCTHYPRAMSLLTELMRSGTETARLLRDRQEALGHTLPLGSYLLKPVQRILKYHLLLQSLRTHSAASPEWQRAATDEALRSMRALADHIDDMKRRHESAVRVQEVQSLIRLWQGEDLTTFGELVAEETFRVPRAKVPRQVFLFEKMLLITKKRDDGTLVYKTHILCSNLMLIESVPGEVDSLQVLPFDDPHEQYTLQARSVESKRQWALRLKGAILESYGQDIPKHARELVMKLGQHRENGAALRRRLSRRTHSVPEYLERRRSVKRTTSAAASVLPPQLPQLTAAQQRQRRRAQQQQQQQQQQRHGQPPDWGPADQQQQQQQHDCSAAASGKSTPPCSPCAGAERASTFLPDLDEEDLEESAGGGRGSPHPSTCTSASSTTPSAVPAAADNGHQRRDDQTIVEQLVLQHKHFQRLWEKPRREVRRSPTSSSDSPSEREPDWSPYLAEAGGRSDSPPAAPAADTRRGEVSPAPSARQGAEAADPPDASSDGEGGDRAAELAAEEDNMPELVSWNEFTLTTVRGPDEQPSAAVSPRTGLRRAQRPQSAITIESRDNVEYVSLFDYGARPLSMAGGPPLEAPAARAEPQPRRTVTHRLSELRQSGRAELRQFFGLFRSKSLRLSRYFEDNGKGPSQRDVRRRDVDSSSVARGEAVPKAAPKAAAEPRQRSTWYCELSEPLEGDGQPQPAAQDEPQRIPGDEPRSQRSQLRSFGSLRVLLRRSGSSAGAERSRWRPLSQLIDVRSRRPPSQSVDGKRRRPLSMVNGKSRGPPLASEVHAASLQRLPGSGGQWQRSGTASPRQSPVSAAHYLHSAPSLRGAESHKCLPAPLEGSTDRLRQRLAHLLSGGGGDRPPPAGDALGARLAASGPLESPLLAGPRRCQPALGSMTSLASNQSSASDSGSETAERCTDGFYEMNMEILEHVSVGMCF
ncbi:pleckstrin homology domain-containing family G member 3-like [Amphibalanus amphitrite]|uniref:pleckstrin homology domain-containing family G member 3-like n=1 Tax=Amphibalanus amphitrite TaxID=1232801 RepID=UPI001C91A4DB|nr:pleckstrin homology domain-containing family G member 3-like [Amphibalanus amphitrite]